MGEPGCLKDGFFNRLQVETGSLDDTFPSGKGDFKGLSVAPNYEINMGSNRIINTGDPICDCDASTKYYVDSKFPARFIDWMKQHDDIEISSLYGENTSPQFIDIVLTEELGQGGLRFRKNINGNNIETILNVINPDEQRYINLANSSGTLIPFDTPSTQTIISRPEDINFLADTTMGVVTKNRFISVDDNRDIATLRNIKVDGDITSDIYTLTKEGDLLGIKDINTQTLQFTNTTDIKTKISAITPTSTRNIQFANSSGTLIPFASPSTKTITSTPEDINFLADTTMGVVTKNRFISVDDNRDIATLRDIKLDGDITSDTYTLGNDGTFKNISSIESRQIIFKRVGENNFKSFFTAITPTSDRSIHLADSSGTLIPFSNPSTSTISVSPEEINQLNKVSSNIQEQIDNKNKTITFSSVKLDEGNNSVTHKKYTNFSGIHVYENDGIEINNIGGTVYFRLRKDQQHYWGDINILDDGGKVSNLDKISPFGIAPLYFLAGNNIELSLSNNIEQNYRKELKIQLEGKIPNDNIENSNITIGTSSVSLGSTITSIDGLKNITIDGGSGLILKNGEVDPVFIQFHDMINEEKYKINLKNKPLSSDITLSLPNTNGNLISTGDSETVTTEMLKKTPVVAKEYGSDKAIPVLDIDSRGRIIGATTSSISTDLQIPRKIQLL